MQFLTVRSALARPTNGNNFATLKHLNLCENVQFPCVSKVLHRWLIEVPGNLLLLCVCITNGMTVDGNEDDANDKVVMIECQISCCCHVDDGNVTPRMVDWRRLKLNPIHNYWTSWKYNHCSTICSKKNAQKTSSWDSVTIWQTFCVQCCLFKFLSHGIQFHSV